MKTNKKLIYSIFVVVFFAISIIFLLNKSFEKNTPHNPSDIKSINIASEKIKLDLALTPEQKSKGLSFRESLARDEGMLFIFDFPGKYSFWMKDMNFPIDIIWISEDQRIVYIKENATPESYPEAYQPGKNDGDAKYILEVVSGFSKQNNLKIGDNIEFLY